jgi:hypothetical protein
VFHRQRVPQLTRAIEGPPAERRNALKYHTPQEGESPHGHDRLCWNARKWYPLDAEKLFAEMIYNEAGRKPCQCSRSRYRKRRRYISLEAYVIKEVQDCQCAAACCGLIAAGFFPAAPRRPGTVFSPRLLRTLHAQSAFGSVSKYAWTAGLHAIFEEDVKTPLPRFDDS